MRFIFIVILLSVFATAKSQIELEISGRSYTNSSDTWIGVNIPRSQSTRLIFRNNTITSSNRFGYLLQAGDEAPAATNNNLDGAIITGNKLNWSGSDMEVIPHGIFAGHNRNVIIKYNYLNHVPMGIIRKSGNNMSDTGGGVAYNIVRGGAVGMVVKGMSNVNIFNNTFYNDRTTAQTWRPLVHVYTNTDADRYSVAHGTKIYNNIFYTKFQTPVITINDQESLTGLECDYNVYWCETGSPVFIIDGVRLTFEQWQARGYDAHSVVMNPNFRDFVNFVPYTRIDRGRDLGAEWAEGLDITARWGTTDPVTTMQNGLWQVGAVLHGTGGGSGGGQQGSATISIYPNPATTYFDIAISGTPELPQVIKIYDMAGKLRFEKRYDAEFIYSIPINLNPGVYILHIDIGSDIKHVQKLVVTR